MSLSFTYHLHGREKGREKGRERQKDIDPGGTHRVYERRARSPAQLGCLPPAGAHYLHMPLSRGTHLARAPVPSLGVLDAVLLRQARREVLRGAGVFGESPRTEVSTRKARARGKPMCEGWRQRDDGTNGWKPHAFAPNSDPVGHRGETGKREPEGERETMNCRAWISEAPRSRLLNSGARTCRRGWARGVGAPGWAGVHATSTGTLHYLLRRGGGRGSVGARGTAQTWLDTHGRGR